MQEHARSIRAEAIVGFNKLPGLDIYFAADPCFEFKAREMRNVFYRSTSRYRAMVRFERAVFRRDAATRILLIAAEQAAQYQKYYRTPDTRLALMPPGIDMSRARSPQWREQRARIRAEFNVSDDGFLLLLVGSGFITKGVGRAIVALRSCRIRCGTERSCW